MKVLGLALVCVVLAGTVGLIGMEEDCQKTENAGNTDETHVINEDYMVNGWEMHVKYMNLSNVNVDEVI
jgi:hypothetical protein